MLKFILLQLFFIFHIQLLAQSTKVIDVYIEKDSANYLAVNFDELFSERWDTLPQVKFWRKVMDYGSDTCIINIAATREVLGFENVVKWGYQSEEEKQHYKDSVRVVHCLDSTTKIYVTFGKRDFYLIEETFPSISKAIVLFQEFETDPWFAQAILLIESPGKMAYSNAGAYGAFQLMKSVARKYGLIVNKEIDERKDFKKSAKAASSLISKVCIPEAKRILDKKGIDFSESDLWFKFLVLHIYHAGAGNVGGLINQLEEQKTGIDLISWIWQNEWGGFKNASQNYSQVAIASLLGLHELIYDKCDSIYNCNAF